MQEAYDSSALSHKTIFGAVTVARTQMWIASLKQSNYESRKSINHSVLQHSGSESRKWTIPQYSWKLKILNTHPLWYLNPVTVKMGKQSDQPLLNAVFFAYDESECKTGALTQLTYSIPSSCMLTQGMPWSSHGQSLHRVVITLNCNSGQEGVCEWMLLWQLLWGGNGTWQSWYLNPL